MTLQPRDALAELARLSAVTDSELRSNKPVRTARLRHQLQQLFDVAQKRESIVLACLQLQPSRALGPHHGTACATLCMLMGMRLGLLPDKCIDLAVSGLLHAPGATDPSAGTDLAKVVKRMPLQSALALGRGIITPFTLRQIALAADHIESIRNDDGQLHARLVSVAAAYNLLCAQGAPGLGQTSAMAMRVLLFLGGRQFDERATRLLAATVGLYAPGAKVELNGMDKGVVLERPKDPPRFDRPVVSVGGDVIDLSEANRSIVRELKPGGAPELQEYFVGPL